MNNILHFPEPSRAQSNIIAMTAWRGPKRSYDLHTELLLAEAFIDFHELAIKRGYAIDTVLMAQDYARRAMDIMGERHE